MGAAYMTPSLESNLRSQLEDRRGRLQSAISALNRPGDLVRLLAEVDSALSRLDGAGFGECAVCLGQVDEADLMANPMATYCLCDLTAERRQALERDLGLAWKVQAALLPPLGLTVPGWETHYRYLPHGAVSGDYCDLIVADGGERTGLYFMVGDVSGKGVAASLLMAHLNAALRALAQNRLPPVEMIARADDMLRRSTLTSHYATLACGLARASGEVELANAGHCPPLVVRRSGDVESLPAGGLPLGLTFPGAVGSRPAVQRLTLHPGDALALYTDGITEAANAAGEEHGCDRLAGALRGSRSPSDLTARCLASLESFLNGAERADDLTVLALMRP